MADHLSQLDIYRRELREQEAFDRKLEKARKEAIDPSSRPKPRSKAPAKPKRDHRTKKERVMSETQFTTMVMQLFRMYNWKVSHFGSSVKYVRNPTGSGYKVIPDKNSAGFPDIIAIKGTRMIVAELKLRGKTVRNNQADWLEAFRGLPNVEVFVWRPDDLQEIQQVINSISTTI